MFIFKALYSEIKAWPKDYGYCRLASSCDCGIKYCKGLNCHNKSWVTRVKSCYRRWMFLDGETIKVILPVGDFKGHLVRVPGGPHQVRSFPAAGPSPAQPLCFRAELQTWHSHRWSLPHSTPLWGSRRKKKCQKVFKEFHRVKVSFKFTLTWIFMYTVVHLSHTWPPAWCPAAGWSRMMQAPFSHSLDLGTVSCAGFWVLPYKFIT